MDDVEHFTDGRGQPGCSGAAARRTPQRKRACAHPTGAGARCDREGAPWPRTWARGGGSHSSQPRGAAIDSFFAAFGANGVIVLHGCLHASWADRFHEAMSWREPDAPLRIDLASVTSVDGVGVSLLCGIAAGEQRAGRRLQIIDPSPAAAHALRTVLRPAER